MHACTHKAVATSGLREQRAYRLQDADVLVMGITLHHGCWDAKHNWVSDEERLAG